MICWGCKALAGERDLNETKIIRVYCKLKRPIQVFHCINDQPVGAKPLQECKGVATWADLYEKAGRMRDGEVY
jgi:hypothetical protein